MRVPLLNSLLLIAVYLGTFSHVNARVDNFVLLDHHGDAHELYYHKDAAAIVLMVQGNGCQIVRSNLAEFQALQTEFSDKGVQFFMLNANLQDERSALAEEAAEWGIKVPILKDRTQMIAHGLNLQRTGEVLVINPQDWSLVYRGALSDRVDYERQKESAKKEYVKLALTAVLAGQDVANKEVVAPGCIINYGDEFDEPAEQISYSKTVAPILRDNCGACHVQGGIAPWAMSEYRMVKGFAPMMREVLRTKRMPPWHSDPEIGEWHNNQALSDHDTQTLLRWIEAGAPRGEGEDPLLKLAPIENKWTLGEPDLVIDIPPFEIPANGIVDYQFPMVANPLDRDVWVVGAAVIPGDTKAVHHILVGSSEQAPATNDLGDIFENFILSYAPGNESSFMPKGTGVFVPKGGVYQFQMHYTPYGKKTVDRSKVGLYLADKPPANFYREHVLVNPRIRIPAGAAEHEEKAYFKFWQDATIHSLFPHSHYRGRSSEFELVYPDGQKEILLSVPNYDFNWQRTYQLKKPVQAPAGSKIIHRTVYDNSPKNRGNPDPSSDVLWGLQSEQEMLYGSMGFTWNNETTAKPTHQDGITGLSTLMGFWDQNINDHVEPDELPARIKQRVGDEWRSFDKDKSGHLNFKELGALIKHINGAQVIGD